MKYFRVILINIIVAFGLALLIGLVIYFYSLKKMNDFFHIKTDDQIAYLQKDSLAMFVHKPNIFIYDNWGTPEMKISTERRTNNLGFREDEDTVKKKWNEYRVLVTGDSHTDGVLKHNYQSFINVWEKLQNEADTTFNYNFINGGTAFYTFRNYLGFLKKYKFLKPDVYFINVFTGNDFREAPIFEENRTNVINVFKNVYVRMHKMFYTSKQKSIPFAQGIEQSLYFSKFPDDKKKSLALAKYYLSQIKEICLEENIKLVVTLQPSKIEANSTFKDELKSIFGFNDELLSINEELTASLASWLDSENIVNLNLTPPLKNANEKVFWDVDLHTNPKGLEVIAKFLFEHSTLCLH